MILPKINSTWLFAFWYKYSVMITHICDIIFRLDSKLHSYIRTLFPQCGLSVLASMIFEPLNTLRSSDVSEALEDQYKRCIWIIKSLTSKVLPVEVPLIVVSRRLRMSLAVRRSWWVSSGRFRACPWSCVAGRVSDPSVVYTACTQRKTNPPKSHKQYPLITPTEKT